MPGRVFFFSWSIYKGCIKKGGGHDFYLHKPINRFTHSLGSFFFFFGASLTLSSSIMFSERTLGCQALSAERTQRDFSLFLSLHGLDGRRASARRGDSIENLLVK